MSSRWLQKQQQREAEERQSDPVAIAVETLPKKWRSGDYHIWRRGDSLVDLAREMHVTLERLSAYNEIETYQELEPGVPIYFPIVESVIRRTIRIELLPEKAEMHVNKPNGAKRWAFGGMKTWNDAKPSGFYPENTNLEIVAIAYVPIEDKDDPNMEAAYYLDKLSLGDYAETGRLRYTLGYAHGDLETGRVETVTVTQSVTEAVAEEQVKPKAERVSRFLDGFDKAFVEKRLEDYKRDATLQRFLDSYQPVDPVAPCMVALQDDPTTYQIDSNSGARFIRARDFALKVRDKKFYQHEEVEIGATFEYEGELYGRTVESIESKTFHGIPMSMLRLESDLFMYNKPIDASVRIESGGHLTWSEQRIWVPITKILTRFSPGYMRRIKNTKIKKG